MGVLLSRAVSVVMHQESGAKSRYSLCLLDIEKEEDFLMAPEHLQTSLPCSLFSPKQVPWALAHLLPLQQLALLSLCPQTWLKGTCSWDIWAGTSEQTPAPSPPLRWKASPRWPCATATTTSAVSPWRQVPLQAGAGRRDVASSGCHLPAGWKSQCFIHGDLAASDTSPDVLLGALNMTPIVADKPSAHSRARACTHTFLFPLTKGPTDAAPVASALIPALVREHFPLNVSVQSSFHLMHSSPALLALSAGCQQASFPAHGHPPAPRVLAEAADGEPGVPQAPQQDVPTGFPRKSHPAERAGPGTASRFVHTSPSQQMHVLIATHPCSHALLCKLTCTVCASWRCARTRPCP